MRKDILVIKLRDGRRFDSLILCPFCFGFVSEFQWDGC